ncbi:hypothetical protein BH10PLA2_BH10PLA2_20630 [soil metagenome]
MGHEFRTVHEMGWAGKKNGELLGLLVKAGFEVLLTVDQNLRFQQNLVSSEVAIVIMAATGIRLVDLEPLIPLVYAALHSIRPGDVVVVPAPGTSLRTQDPPSGTGEWRV